MMPGPITAPKYSLIDDNGLPERIVDEMEILIIPNPCLRRRHVLSYNTDRRGSAPFVRSVVVSRLYQRPTHYAITRLVERTYESYKTPLPVVRCGSLRLGVEATVVLAVIQSLDVPH